MKSTRNFKITTLIAVLGMSLLTSCREDDKVEETKIRPSFVVGLESTAGTDVLLGIKDLTTEISPINNGIAQDAWGTYYQIGKTILSLGYSTEHRIVSHGVVDGELVELDRVFTNKGLYAFGEADKDTFIAIGLDREGHSEREIYVIDVPSMTITNTVKTNWDKREADTTITFPTDISVRGDKLFISYYLVDDGGKFQTPDSNQARVAVYSYPELEFEKIMRDDRTSDVGRYLSQNVLEKDENNDIYTFSSSSLACGFAPTPTNPSGFLRIKNNETEFDDSYFFDFETLSGGYKVNDMIYVGGGKAVVRMLKEDSTNADFLWATYYPKSENPICEFGIVDLYNKTVNKVTGIPLSAGEWSFAKLIKDGDVYLNVNSSSGAFIYKVDVETATANQSSVLIANYAKAIFEL